MSAATGPSGCKARVGFVTLSSAEQALPSTRIAVLNVLPLLRQSSYEATIVHALPVPSETPRLPPELLQRIVSSGCAIVVFQKMRGPDVLALARALEARGIRTVYQVCDLVDAAMAEATSATLVVTDFLRSLYPSELQPRIHVVHDGIEHPEYACPEPAAASRSDAPLHAVLVTSAELEHLPVLGNPPPWLRVTVVARYPPRSDRAARWRTGRWSLARRTDWRGKLAFLRFATHPRIVREAWDAEGVYRHLMTADVGIIPVDTGAEPDAPSSPAVPAWKVKSENRLTMKMALGLPVIATPIPAYLPIVSQGVNGFLADTRDDWLDCLRQLRDPARRREIGAAARASVIARYSKEEQARRMAEVFDRVLMQRP